MRFVSSMFSVLIMMVLVSPVGAAPLKAGYAQREITPPPGLPMWGYGGPRALGKAIGTLDPLYCKAIVLEAGEDKLALVGLDLGRGPTEPMMKAIRQGVLEQAGVNHVMISGSHTHHGPVIEMLDEPGRGQDGYGEAVAYAGELEEKIIEAIVEAAGATQPARLGWETKQVAMNRNRHSKLPGKPEDEELIVLRIDDESGEAIAVAVNYAAHPTMMSPIVLQYSADWPGRMMDEVETRLGVPCVFLQGAAGDMSVDQPEGVKNFDEYGRALGEHVVALAQDMETTVPQTASIQGRTNSYAFETRVDLTDPVIVQRLGQAFFPEFVQAFLTELPGSVIRPQLTTLLVNGQVALVGASGEFFCSHAIRLKERSRAELTMFVGYCNGHHLYFPTIEAAAEGGYGADETVSWVPIGTGEQMVDEALFNIYQMMGAYPEAEFVEAAEVEAAEVEAGEAETGELVGAE